MTVNKNEAGRLPQRFIFNESNQQVRTVVIDHQPYFVAKDICDILGHTNASVAIQMLDDDERTKESLGRQGATWVVNESGLYNLIFRSNKPGAKSFRRWVTGQVLPAIRKTGSYSVNLSNHVPLSRYNQLREMYDFQVEQVRWWTDMYGRQTKIVANLVDQMMERKANQLQTPTWMTVVGYATLHNISCGLNIAGRLGRKAADLCARQGIKPDTIPDPRFGRVNIYPPHILEEVFSTI